MTGAEALAAHLGTGVSTTCRAWALMRRNGAVMGFTDHDRALHFEGIEFRPETGMSARAVAAGTGLAVNNTEALGALSDTAIREADIEAGRYDGASVRAWIVNWSDVSQRQLQFRGSIGELRRAGGAFEAELRGLTDVLNRPVGRVYHKPCTAVLGDGACGFAVTMPGYFADMAVEEVEERRVFRFSSLAGFAPAWFRHGLLRMDSGEAAGLRGPIKSDVDEAGVRVIELWAPLRAPIVAGDCLRLIAGCDKRGETCRLKFNNYLNFQGFPDIPGDDWTISDPSRAGRLDGGSRRG